MSQDLEEARKKWPTPSTDYKVGQADIDSKKEWQPPSSYPKGGEYHQIRAWTFRSGHSIEIDETKDGERIRIIHPKGTFTEVNPDGSMVRRSEGNDYEIVVKDKNVKVKGTINIHIEGDANMKVDGNFKGEVGGDFDMTVGGHVEWKTGGKHHTDTPNFHVTGDAMGHNSKDVGDTHRHTEVMSGPSTTGLPTPDHGG